MLFLFFFPRFPSDKPQVCLLTPLICLVCARSATQSTRMAHNEAGTVPGSPRLITVSAVMALHCCGGTMLLRPPCRSGRARPAFEVSFSLSVSDGLLVAPGMIDDADQEGKKGSRFEMSHTFCWLLTYRVIILEARSASSRPTFAPVHRNEFTAFDLFIQRTTAHSCRVCVGVRKLRAGFPPAVWLATGLLTHVTPHAVFQKTH